MFGSKMSSASAAQLRRCRRCSLVLPLICRSDALRLLNSIKTASIFLWQRGESTERRGGFACCVLLLDFSFLVFNYFCAIFELSRGPLARPASASVSLLGVNLFLIFIIYLRHAISLSLSLSQSQSPCEQQRQLCLTFKWIARNSIIKTADVSEGKAEGLWQGKVESAGVSMEHSRMQLISVLCSNDIRCAAFRLGASTRRRSRRRRREIDTERERERDIIAQNGVAGTNLSSCKNAIKLPAKCPHPIAPSPPQLIWHDHSTSGN